MIDAAVVQQRVRHGGVVQCQIARLKHGLPIALDDHAATRHLQPEEQAGFHVVAGRFRGAPNGCGVGAYGTDGESTQVTDGHGGGDLVWLGVVRDLDADNGVPDGFSDRFHPFTGRDLTGVEGNGHRDTFRSGLRSCQGSGSHSRRTGAVRRDGSADC